MDGDNNSEDFSDKYSISFNPEYWVKFRQRRGNCDLGVDVSPTSEDKPVRLVLKPYGEFWKKKRWWSKVELYPFDRDLRVYTRKVDYGPLNLQLVANHNVGTMRSGIHWRVGTNFLQGGSRQKLKYNLYSDDDLQADLNMHWNAEISMPNMEGGVTGSGGQIDIVTGHCHLDVPQIDAKFRFHGRRKKGKGQGKTETEAKAPAGRGTHIVEDGEWLSKIASQYDTTTDKLRQLNSKSIGEGDLIFPGQKLVIE
ncbi:LysM domain-containing protein [Chloropicon primus]|uniref:LysM domain-containing protein n=3 Tax=Chloropicon primus TaxID=1764295 RepID=A0A5B8MKE3_9CHLO|nr:hypothetical protein A3770_04p32490 [Chloropicon primus]UPQ99943.1 LysM domain-containing protein [Chloropicon primus]|eukprot:QDZ20731.1 hypothetical protein A3770_04p32490 [Chloropicon primus]